MSASSTPRRRPQYPESLTDLHRFRKTAHGHDGSSRIVMVRKTDQRTFASIEKGHEPKLETVTRETIETFRGQRTEYRFTTETKDTGNECPADVLHVLQNPPKIIIKKKASKVSFNLECLRAHNEYREKHGVPPLKLNKEISKISQAWADVLIKKNVIQQSNNQNYGENLFCMESTDPKFVLTARSVVDRWYSEINKHHFGIEPKSLKSGHFTQIIWRDSRELGIGVAKLKGKVIIVANYNPPGNFLGQFAENVPPLTLTNQTENTRDVLTENQTNFKNVKKGVSNNFVEEFLEKHNEFRQLHGVPKLKLDKELCRYSETWANYLATKNVLMHRPESNYGENIFGVSLNSSSIYIRGDEPVTHWYNDMNDYPFGREPKNLKNGGHFTQVIWKSSEYLGVGFARNNNRVFVVANYSPAGNFVGDYVNNVPPPIKSRNNNFQINDDGSREECFFNGTEGNFMEEILEAHNIYRIRHNVQPLKMDENISKESQQWADYLASTETLDHNPGAVYGENIYVLQSSDETFSISGYNPVDTWYEEAKYYKFNEEPKDEHSFHFTQLIWKDSKKLGVGTAKSKIGTIYVVVNYSPPGNIHGEFRKNVFPSKVERLILPVKESCDDRGSGMLDREKFATDVLKIHNQYRRKHGCPELVLNKDICDYAQDWAETLSKKTSLTHRLNNKYGENIFSVYSSDFGHVPTARDAVKEWYDEVKYYNSYNSETVNQKALHFTQLIWKSSRELGVGIAKNNKGQTFIVANYYPRGNMGGYFVSNVPKIKS